MIERLREEMIKTSSNVPFRFAVAYRSTAPLGTLPSATFTVIQILPSIGTRPANDLCKGQIPQKVDSLYSEDATGSAVKTGLRVIAINNFS